MRSEHAEILGLVAAALTTGSFFPQVLRTWRTGGADLSFAMLAIFLIGVLLWLGYGLLTASASVVVANVLTAAQVLAILVLKRAHAVRPAEGR